MVVLYYIISYFYTFIFFLNTPTIVILSNIVLVVGIFINSLFVIIIINSINKHYIDLFTVKYYNSHIIYIYFLISGSHKIIIIISSRY